MELSSFQSEAVEKNNKSVNMSRFRKLGAFRGNVNMNIGHIFHSMCKYLNSSFIGSRGVIWTFYEVLLLLTLLLYPCTAHTWESPGCHRVGKCFKQFLDVFIFTTCFGQSCLLLSMLLLFYIENDMSVINCQYV